MGSTEGPVLNIHAVIPASRVNGPGLRMVIFFQGCERGCPGCFNPDTHPINGGKPLTVDEIFSQYHSQSHSGGIEGITVSGGEPFLQPLGLFLLLKTARQTYNLTTVVYTGFLYQEIAGSPRMAQSLPFIDVLIDGPYREELQEPTLLARGSTNQKFHFLSPRYTLPDFVMPGKVEVTISEDGTITETGFSRIEPRR